MFVIKHFRYIIFLVIYEPCHNGSVQFIQLLLHRRQSGNLVGGGMVINSGCLPHRDHQCMPCTTVVVKNRELLYGGPRGFNFEDVLFGFRETKYWRQATSFSFGDSKVK